MSKRFWTRLFEVREVCEVGTWKVLVIFWPEMEDGINLKSMSLDPDNGR